MAFTPLSSSDSRTWSPDLLQRVDNHLREHAFINGHDEPSNVDANVFESIEKSQKTLSDLTHVRRWFDHVASYSKTGSCLLSVFSSGNCMYGNLRMQRVDAFFIVSSCDTLTALRLHLRVCVKQVRYLRQVRQKLYFTCDRLITLAGKIPVTYTYDPFTCVLDYIMSIECSCIVVALKLHHFARCLMKSLNFQSARRSPTIPPSQTSSRP